MPLTKQYRCHPDVTCLIREILDDSTVENSLIEDKVPNIVPGLPALCFFDVIGKNVVSHKVSCRPSSNKSCFASVPNVNCMNLPKILRSTLIHMRIVVFLFDSGTEEEMFQFVGLGALFGRG